jgi:uncharacterized protein involved in exopolysaccharide biosynthesis
MDQIVAIAPLWRRIWARRKGIFVLVTCATLLAGVVAFMMPPWYLAHAELLPPSEDEGGLGLSSLLRGVGLPGVKIPTEVTPGDVFMVILRSRRLSEQIVEKFNLKQLYKRKLMEDTVKDLKTHTSFDLTDAGTIKISVEDRDKQRAADMTNAYIQYLDQFNREIRSTKGRRTRIFVEGRLNEIKTELADAEQRLTEYQVQHKAVALSRNASSAVSQAATLYARRMALEVRLGVVRGYSEGSEEEIQLKQEIAQIDEQMRQLPETGLELARLVRDVTALEQVFALLTAQYEDAKINEARDVVTVDVLDPATTPERKSKPRRILIIGAAFLASSALGAGFALFQGRGQQPTPAS